MGNEPTPEYFHFEYLHFGCTECTTELGTFKPAHAFRLATP